MDKILEWLKIRIHHFTGKEYICYCPFHKQGQERHPSFGVNEEGLFNCFSCGRSGNAVQLVSALLDIDEHKAIKALENRKFDAFLKRLIDIPEWENRFLKHREEFLSESMLDLYPRKKAAIEYLENRGVSKKMRNAFEIGYDRWMKRITFPVRDEQRRLVGIVGRALDNDRFPRYMFYNFKKSHFLYGADTVVDNNHLIVVEGIIDLIHMRQMGFNNTVALMGSKMSEIQRNKVCGNAEEVTLFLDDDEAGEEGIKRAIKMLQDHVVLHYVDWRHYSPGHNAKDPADLKKREVETMLEKRRFFLDWEKRG